MALQSLYDVPAPAKLNLFLHVVGRRADGLHLLQSPFVLIDWVDTLHFERRADSRLQRHDLNAALPADDLCLRAARALQTAAGCVDGVDISISKCVPAEAGMGGGSSDAATTLLALNRLWQLNWSRERLAQIGLHLGADVPFFVGGENAFVEGIGERLTPLTLPRMRFAVLKPASSLSTREIFEHPALVRDSAQVILLGLTGPPRSGLIEDPNATVQVDQMVEGFGHNDLQGPAEDRCPQVAQAAGMLYKVFGNSRMTGSGSAVFARVGDLNSADRQTGAFEHATGKPVAQAQVAWPADELPPGYVARMCRSLLQHPLRDWAD